MYRPVYTHRIAKVRLRVLSTRDIREWRNQLVTEARPKKRARGRRGANRLFRQLAAALAYAKRNLSRSLKIEDLSKVACLSPRQFGRVFRAETGVSPAKAIELLRLETAKPLLLHSKIPIETIAEQTGFGDRERMRRAFLRTFGEPPKSMRDNNRG